MSDEADAMMAQGEEDQMMKDLAEQEKELAERAKVIDWLVDNLGTGISLDDDEMALLKELLLKLDRL